MPIDIEKQISRKDYSVYYKYFYTSDMECDVSDISMRLSFALSFQLPIKQGATKLTKEDIEKVFSLYDRVS